MFGAVLPQGRMHSLVKEKELETKGDSLSSSSLALSTSLYSSSTTSLEGRYPELSFRGHGISSVCLERLIVKSKFIFFFFG